MALVGNMIADAKSGNPSIVNYTMFVAVFGMLSLFYLIAGTINEAFAIAPMFMVAADALNTIFFLVGGIALAAKLGVHSCGNQVSWNETEVHSPVVKTHDTIGLSQVQWGDQWLRQHEQEVSRGSGR